MLEVTGAGEDSIALGVGEDSITLMLGMADDARVDGSN